MSRAENNSEKLFYLDPEWNLCRFVLGAARRPNNQHTDACNQMNLIRFCLVTHAFVVVDNFSRILAHTCSTNILRANIFHYYYYVRVCCMRGVSISQGPMGWRGKKKFGVRVCVRACVRTWCHGDYKLFCQSK